jgi:hypothetical protein
MQIPRTLAARHAALGLPTRRVAAAPVLVRRAAVRGAVLHAAAAPPRPRAQGAGAVFARSGRLVRLANLLRKGLSAELDKQDAISHPGIFEERFDAVRVGDDAAIASMEPYLRTKYAGVQFDAIITENYVAARFLSDRPDLFPGVPRHYVNHGRPGWKPAGWQELSGAGGFQPDHRRHSARRRR